MTIDGSKRTNDNTSLLSQKQPGLTDKRPITSGPRIPSTNEIKLSSTLKIATAQVDEHQLLLTTVLFRTTLTRKIKDYYMWVTVKL